MWTIEGSAFFSRAFWRTSVGVFRGLCSGTSLSLSSCVILACGVLYPAVNFSFAVAFEKVAFPGHGCHRRTGQQIVWEDAFITTITSDLTSLSEAFHDTKSAAQCAVTRQITPRGCMTYNRSLSFIAARTILSISLRDFKPPGSSGVHSTIYFHRKALRG